MRKISFVFRNDFYWFFIKTGVEPIFFNYNNAFGLYCDLTAFMHILFYIDNLRDLRYNTITTSDLNITQGIYSLLEICYFVLSDKPCGDSDRVW